MEDTGVLTIKTTIMDWGGWKERLVVICKCKKKYTVLKKQDITTRIYPPKVCKNCGARFPDLNQIESSIRRRLLFHSAGGPFAFHKNTKNS